MKDPEFLADLDKRKFDLDPVPGDELEKIAKEAAEVNAAVGAPA